MKSIFIKLPLYLLVIIGLVFGLNFLFSPGRDFLPGIRIVKAGDTQNIMGWAWSENIGWFSFNSVDCDNDADGKSDGVPAGCPPAGTTIADYGVNINNISNYLSGYAWSENIGWISFNRSQTGVPPSGDPCPSDNCIAKVVPSGLFRQEGKEVNLEGWARALAACDSVPCLTSGAGTNTGGWDGWIRFDHGQINEPIFRTSDDKMHNWAWDSDDIGWLSFNSDEGGGLYPYAVAYNCRCPDWTYPGCDIDTNPCEDTCGTGVCSITQVPRTRTCTPTGCNDDGDQCFESSVCYHKECKDGECVDIAGKGTDLCSTDSNCVVKPWLNWKWWEIIPRK